MPVSVLGEQFIANISQNQALPAGPYFKQVRLFVVQPAVDVPTEFVGWLNLYFVRGPQGSDFAINYDSRSALTTDGGSIIVPSLPGVIVPGDTFSGWQVVAWWKVPGIEYSVVIV